MGPLLFSGGPRRDGIQWQSPERRGARARAEADRHALPPGRRPRQGHRPDALRRRPRLPAPGLRQARARDGAARPHPLDRPLEGGAGRRRRRIPDRPRPADDLRHPAGLPGRARAGARHRPPRRRPGGGGGGDDRGRGAAGRARGRDRLRAAADDRDRRGGGRDRRTAAPRLRRPRQPAQGGRHGVRRRRGRIRRSRPRLRGPLLLRGQHPPRPRAACDRRRARGPGAADRLLLDPDAALPAPRPRQGARPAGRAHPRGRDTQRRRFRRQERPVRPRDRRRRDGAEARAAGADRAHPRGGLLLPSRPPPGADAPQDRRPRRRLAHRPGALDHARRRRLRQLRRRLDLLHRRAADRHLPPAALPVRVGARLHQQAGVRTQARPWHAAAPLRLRGAARQDRRRARHQPRRPPAGDRRSARHRHRQLAAARHRRARPLPRGGRRRRSLPRALGMPARGAGSRPRLRRLPVRRRPADLLEPHAAVGGRAARRSRRRRRGLLRRDRDRPGLRLGAGRGGRRRARPRARRSAAVRRRHRVHSGRSRQLLLARHPDDGPRGTRGRRAPAGADRDRGRSPARGAARAVWCSPTGASSTPPNRRAG